MKESVCACVWLVMATWVMAHETMTYVRVRRCRSVLMKTNGHSEEISTKLDNQADNDATKR